MSMTREEALEELERLLRHWDDLENDKRCFWGYDKEAVALAIAALRPITREQVEKAWRGCDLCLDDSWQRILMIPKRFDHTNMLSTELAQFCPGCGRPLTDEAVDMVMERLEEVLNADTGSM